MWPFIKKRKNVVHAAPIVNVIDEEYALNFCIEWNLKFPIDRWFRERHKIPFNSPVHRSLSFWDMRIEFEEHLMFYRNEHSAKYIPDTGLWLKEDEVINADADLSEEERLMKYKNEFESMDLDKYRD